MEGASNPTSICDAAENWTSRQTRSAPEMRCTWNSRWWNPARWQQTLQPSSSCRPTSRWSKKTIRDWQVRCTCVFASLRADDSTSLGCLYNQLMLSYYTDRENFSRRRLAMCIISTADCQTFTSRHSTREQHRSSQQLLLETNAFVSRIVNRNQRICSSTSRLTVTITRQLDDYSMRGNK